MADIEVEQGNTLSIDYIVENFGDTVGDPRSIELLVENLQPESGVANWTFDSEETVSGQAIDVWGTNDATINGPTTVDVTGANQTYTTNGAYRFDGSGDKVQSPVPLDTSSGFTVNYWIKTTDDGSGFDHFWSTYDGTEGAFLQLEDTGSAVFIMNSSSGTNARVVTPEAVNDGSWAMFTYVWDGSQLTAYLDGISIGFDSTTISGTHGNLAFGAQPINTAYQAHTGDDPRVYNKALTDQEVQNLYYTGSILLDTLTYSRLSSWNFEDETDTSTVIDTGVSNNDLTANGPVYTTNSKVGDHAREYDGTDQVDTGPSINLGVDSFSIVGWVIDNAGSNRHYFGGLESNSSSLKEFFGTDESGEFYYRDSANVGGDILDSSTTSIRDGTYHFFGLAIDVENDEVRTNIDGINDFTLSTPITQRDRTDVTFQLGNRGDNTSGRFHDGILDYIQWYDRALSESEFQSIYNDTV